MPIGGHDHVICMCAVRGGCDGMHPYGQGNAYFFYIFLVILMCDTKVA